jgi:hypothetical protein
VRFPTLERTAVECILWVPDAFLSGCVEPGRRRRCGLEDQGRRVMPRTNKRKSCVECVTVVCPTTRTSIPTKIATDVRSLAKAWHSKIKVSCPHCGMVHTYRVCEAFIEAAISQVRLRGEHTVSDLSPLRPGAVIVRGQGHGSATNG